MSESPKRWFKHWAPKLTFEVEKRLRLLSVSSTFYIEAFTLVSHPLGLENFFHCHAIFFFHFEKSVQNSFHVIRKFLCVSFFVFAMFHISRYKLSIVLKPFDPKWESIVEHKKECNSHSPTVRSEWAIWNTFVYLNTAREIRGKGKCKRPILLKNKE